METVEINTDFIKLSQFIKWIGLVNIGSEANLLIAEGKVEVNGEKSLQRGKKLVAGDIVKIKGKEYKVG